VGTDRARGSKRERAWALVTAVAVFGSATALTLGAQPSGAIEIGVTDAAIVRTAIASAAGAGERAPESLAWVATSRRAANQTSGELLPTSLGRERVYFVVMRGHFVLHPAGIADRLTVPAGDVETLTISAATGRVRDVGISDVVPDLAALGAVTRVDRPARDRSFVAHRTDTQTPLTDTSTNPCHASHCYATAELIVNPPEGFTGIYGTLRSNCIGVPKPKSGFVDNELWIVSGSHWVEAGITVGSAAIGGFYPTPVFFWADQRPGKGGYHEHYGRAATLRQSHSIAIKYTGAGPTWKVSGAISGTSTLSIASPANFLEGGVESTSFRNTTYGTVTNAGYWDPSGALHPGWSTADVLPTKRATTHRMSFHWLDKYDSWRGSQSGTC